MNSMCPQCGSRIAEGDSNCLACLLLEALDDPSEIPSKKPVPEAEERRIGCYEIVRLLGTGGTANVYLAWQVEPIGREVALKLVRPGLGTARVVARFESERLVLARLRHPHIAKIFDAGQTEAGLPYFALEYVEGVPVTEFADREELSLEERLRLFVAVCDAVTHAHQRGVVHRDLKPSNVLVDADGQPKVIDFGIARALEEDFGNETLFLTREGEMLGTPAYMSPEQALGQMAEIDTRSDVFSLGAILYELLTGKLPVDIDRLRGASPLELRRILTQTDYPRPSLRDTTTRIPGGAIRGDLDWIVMKALERDKERRYGSVAALAEDIGRHLANEPVSAGPPTVGYRLRKFVRRNRAVVAGSAIAVMALLAGTGISVTQAMRAKAAEDRAVGQARRARAAEAEAVAQAEKAISEKKVSDAINQFFIGDLLGADLRNAARPDVTLRELVDVAAAKNGERFHDQPEVARAVEMAIGDLYDALGEFEKAQACYLRGREHHRKLTDASEGDRDREELLLLRRLAINAGRQGRTAKEREYWDEWQALASRTEVPARQLLTGNLERALILADEGRITESIEKMRTLLPEFEKEFGPDHPSALMLKVNLGRHLVAARDSEAGLPLLEEYVEKARPIGESISLADALTDLGLEYARQGRLDHSKKAFDEALAIEENGLEPDHPSRLRTRSSLATAYRETGRPQLAVPVYREIFELGTRSGGPMPLECLVAGLNFGMGIIMAAPGEAKPVFEKVLAGLAELGTEYGELRSQTSFQLAISMWLSGQKDEAVSRLNDEVALA
ncbi:MAG: serine/threonine-protein kinase [Verrucomicrobiales bacterium]